MAEPEENTPAGTPAPVLELPLKNQRYRSELGAPGEPVLDVTLRAGDTMYLPRGWLHQALTSGSDSLHITVGVNVRLLADRIGPHGSDAVRVGVRPWWVEAVTSFLRCEGLALLSETPQTEIDDEPVKELTAG